MYPTTDVGVWFIVLVLVLVFEETNPCASGCQEPDRESVELDTQRSEFRGEFERICARVCIAAKGESSKHATGG